MPAPCINSQQGHRDPLEAEAADLSTKLYPGSVPTNPTD
jgi:hypothetical protein